MKRVQNIRRTEPFTRYPLDVRLTAGKGSDRKGDGQIDASRHPDTLPASQKARVNRPHASRDRRNRRIAHDEPRFLRSRGGATDLEGGREVRGGELAARA